MVNKDSFGTSKLKIVSKPSTDKSFGRRNTNSKGNLVSQDFVHDRIKFGVHLVCRLIVPIDPELFFSSLCDQPSIGIISRTSTVPSPSKIGQPLESSTASSIVFALTIR